MHPDVRELIEDLELLPEGRFALGAGRGMADWPADVRFPGDSGADGEGLAVDREGSLLTDRDARSATSRFERAGPDLALSPMVDVLTAFLYSQYYMRPSSSLRQTPADVVAARDFRRTLIHSSPHDEAWQPGFHFVRNASNGLIVTRRKLTFLARTGSVRPLGGKGGPGDLRPGDLCSVRLGRQYRWQSPGFHLVVGSTEARHAEGTGVRLYWHLRADQATTFLSEAVTRLDRAGLAFTVKVLHSPDLYRRADAGVLYLARDDVAVASAVVSALHDLCVTGLRPEIPRFTKHLAHGLGLAEGPSDGDSFGMHRCRTIAEALAVAYEGGLRDSRARIATVTDAFRRAGISLETPYLSTGSTDDYDEVVQGTSRHRARRVGTNDVPTSDTSSLPDTHVAVAPTAPITARQARRRAFGRESAATLASSEASTGPTKAPREGLLFAARTLGRQLCQSAVWDENREHCTWLGRSNPATTQGYRDHEPVSAVVNGHLYAGASGISLFLAELYRLTAEPDFARTARGGMAAAVHATPSNSTQEQEERRLGLYTGLSGLAVARCRVNRLLDIPLNPGDEFLALARHLDRPDHDWVNDLLTGRAGVILALLALRRQGCPAEVDTLSLAVRLADDLCRAGVNGWRSAGDDPELLTGLSHGASGIGLALLELHAATGAERFLSASHDAFAYEDDLFDPARLNWPDLRQGDRDNEGPPFQTDGSEKNGQRKGTERRFALAWCHGAPGIALARLRAHDLDVAWRSRHLDAARAGLQSTVQAVEEVLSSSDGTEALDLTPCHGLTGLVETLWVGGLRLDDPALRAAASRAGAAVAAAVAAGTTIRSGTLCGGPNPSLMLGAAGIGHTLLRLHSPAHVPSMMLIR